MAGHSSTPFPVDPTLASTFKSAVSGNTSFVSVKIENEKLLLDSTGTSTGNHASDYAAMASKAPENEARYFLFKFGPKDWILITYVPPATPVAKKMVYASAKGALKTELGFQHFTNELHANNREELSWDFYQGTLKNVSAYSPFELMHQKVLKEEEAARKEAYEKLSSSASGGSGGYHIVNIPLEASAKQLIDKFRQGTANFVELKISDDKAHVVGVASKDVTVAALPNAINSGEPRFYLYNQNQRKFFIYCCPDESPHQMRMVYSTSKPSVADSCDVPFFKKIEIQSGSELNDEYFRGVGQASLAIPGGVTGGAKRPTTWYAPPSVDSPKSKHLTGTQASSNSPHPVYSLMGATNSPNSGKKKIVIPPSGAW